MKLNWTTHPSWGPPGTTQLRATLPDGRQVKVVPLFDENVIYGYDFLVDGRKPGRAPSQTERGAITAAETWAAEHFPLQALAQVTRPNPDIPMKAVGHQAEQVKKLRRFLSVAFHPDHLVSRLGRQPTAREVADATQLQSMVGVADWQQLNQMLEPFLREQVAVPPGWALPARTAPRPPPVLRAPSERERIKRNQDAIRKGLKSVFNRLWYRMDKGMQEELVAEAFVVWLAAGGTGHISPADAQDVAKKVRIERRKALEKEISFGDYDKDEAGEWVPPEQAEEDNTRAGQAQLASDFRDTLEQSGPAGKLQVALVELHLGETVFPGQPARLKGDAPVRDLRRRHPGIGQKCPTCRSIAHYVRVRGLTPEGVARAVDDYYIRLRQALEP